MEETEIKNSGRALSGETKENNLVFDHYFGTAEKTELVSSYVAQTYYRPYNPDDLYQKAGDHSIYEEMALDDQVSVCLQLKKDLIVGGGWDIICDDESNQAIGDDIYSRLEEDPDEALDDYLDTLVDNANIFGFGLAEKVFQKRTDGTLSLKSLKTRHPDSWLIHTDIKGNIESYEQRASNNSIYIDPKSIMAYTPNRSTVGPYGRSDLRKIYSAWFTKRHISRYYSIFLEKAASPIPVAKYDTNLPDDKVTDLHNIIKKFQTKTALTIPKQIEIEFLEAKSNGDAFIKGINIFNMFIGRGMFIPDLLGLSGSESGGGSQALGREQVEMFLKHIDHRRRTVERLINKQIIQPLCVYNYGFMEHYPKFQFRPITQEDTKEYARLYIEAVKGKFYEPTEQEVNHLRSLLKFPEGDVELIKQGSAGGQPFNPFAPKAKINEEEPEEAEEEEVEEEEEKEEFKFAMYPKIVGDYADKVDFKTLEEMLNADEKSLLSELTPLINEIYKDLFAQLERKRILGNNPKPEKLGELKLKKLATMNSIMKRHFAESYKKQGNLAMSELLKSKFAQPLPSDKFLDVLNTEIYDFIGDWEYKVTQAARLEMITAIKDGKPLSSVIDLLDTQGKQDSQVALERYARTKYTEVMNKARIAVYDEMEIVDSYQYSAILDGRTSDVCAGLHGKIFKKGTEPVPPLHFNCRSTLIPITIFEKKEIDTQVGGEVEYRDPEDRNAVKTRNIPKQPIESFIEENLGKGFGRK